MTSNLALTKKAYGSRYWAIFMTLIYAVLFLQLFAVVLCATLLAYETFSLYYAMLKTVLYCLLLLSFPFSIFYMWSNYRKCNYNQTYIISLFPIFVFLILNLLDWYFDVLLNPWY